MRYCRTCKLDTIEEDNFNVAQLQCKPCVASYSKEYRKNNKEKISQVKKVHYELNKEEINNINKEWYSENKDKSNAQKKEYYQENKSDFISRANEYKNNNLEKVQGYQKIYRVENKDKSNARYRERRKSDPLFKLSTTLRARTVVAFKRRGWKKGSSNEILLGTDYKTAMSHLESFFVEGMTWSNHGAWEIDHHIPLASAKNEEDLRKLCHYLNLRPLWKDDNRKKSAKLNWIKK